MRVYAVHHNSPVLRNEKPTNVYEARSSLSHVLSVVLNGRFDLTSFHADEITEDALRSARQKSGWR